MTLRTLLLSASLLLTACAAPNIPKDFNVDKAAGTGVATGTITYDGGYAAYRLHVRNSATGEKTLIEHGEAQTLFHLGRAIGGEKPDPDLGRKGSSFAVELPAGTYVVDSWQISQGAANVGSTAPTGIQFEIRPHEAIYLGNFHFNETSRFGRAVTGSMLALSDQSARDLPIIRKRFVALAAVPLTQTLSADAKLDNVGGASDGRITIPVFIPVAR